jgi:plastocyanin
MVGKESKNFKVTIVLDEKECRVVPGEFIASVGDKVTFINLVKSYVTILFTEKNPFGVKSVELKESGDGSTATLPVLDVDSGGYIYDVFNHSRATRSSSATRPIIIIYPLP